MTERFTDIESKEYLRQFFDVTDDFIFILDANVRFIEVYADASRMNHKIKDIIGKRPADVFQPDLAKKIDTALKKVKKGQIATYMHSLQQPHGYRHYHTKVAPLGKSGSFRGAILIARDVTEIEQMRLEIQETEQKYRKLFNNSPILMILADFKTNSILDVNEVYERLTGFTGAEVVGKKNYRLGFLADDQEQVRSIRQTILNGGEVTGREITVTNRQGDKLILLLYIVPISINGADLHLLSGIDITAYKQMEAALLKSRQREHMAMAVATDGLWDMDLQTNEVFFNKRYYEMAGYEPQAFPSRLEEFKKRVHPDDVDRVMAAAAACLSGKTTKLSVEFRFKRADMSWMWIRGRGEVVERSSDGVPKRFVGTHTDITERRKMEQAIKESEARFRYVLENIQLVGLMLDANAKILFANDYLLNLTGWKREEVIGKNWFELFIPGVVQPEVLTVFHKAFDENNIKNNYTNSIKTKSGELRTISWNNTLYYGANNKPVAVTSIGEDITERIQTERELAQHRNHLEELVKERTRELRLKNEELEEYNKLFIGREFRIKELKDELKVYHEKYGKL